MKAPISDFLQADHARLDDLLRRAVAGLGEIDQVAYAAFRAGLLKHIALEEKILLPAARRLRGGEPLPVARRLRVEHGAIALLLVPSPIRELVEEIRSILEPHNRLEEAPDGLARDREGHAGTRKESSSCSQRRVHPSVCYLGGDTPSSSS